MSSQRQFSLYQRPSSLSISPVDISVPSAPLLRFSGEDSWKSLIVNPDLIRPLEDYIDPGIYGSDLSIASDDFDHTEEVEERFALSHEERTELKKLVDKWEGSADPDRYESNLVSLMLKLERQGTLSFLETSKELGQVLAILQDTGPDLENTEKLISTCCQRLESMQNSLSQLEDEGGNLRRMEDSLNQLKVVVRQISSISIPAKITSTTPTLSLPDDKELVCDSAETIVERINAKLVAEALNSLQCVQDIRKEQKNLTNILSLKIKTYFHAAVRTVCSSSQAVSVGKKTEINMSVPHDIHIELSKPRDLLATLSEMSPATLDECTTTYVQQIKSYYQTMISANTERLIAYIRKYPKFEKGAAPFELSRSEAYSFREIHTLVQQGLARETPRNPEERFDLSKHSTMETLYFLYDTIENIVTEEEEFIRTTMFVKTKPAKNDFRTSAKINTKLTTIFEPHLELLFVRFAETISKRKNHCFVVIGMLAFFTHKIGVVGEKSSYMQNLLSNLQPKLKKLVEEKIIEPCLAALQSTVIPRRPALYPFISHTIFFVGYSFELMNRCDKETQFLVASWLKLNAFVKQMLALVDLHEQQFTSSQQKLAMVMTSSHFVTNCLKQLKDTVEEEPFLFMYQINGTMKKTETDASTGHDAVSACPVLFSIRSTDSFMEIAKKELASLEDSCDRSITKYVNHVVTSNMNEVVTWIHDANIELQYSTNPLDLPYNTRFKTEKFLNIARKFKNQLGDGFSGIKKDIKADLPKDGKLYDTIQLELRVFFKQLMTSWKKLRTSCYPNETVESVTEQLLEEQFEYLEGKLNL